MDEFLAQKIIETAELVGVKVGMKEATDFLTYLNLLLDWNQRMNLTAITDPEEIVVKHFIDSLALVPHLKEYPTLSILDVGTGAGFPGIPLKIVLPHINVVLLDSLKKRVLFLDAVIGELGLKGISAVHGRAEDFGKQPDYREAFDIVTSRAVAKLSVLSELCIPFVKVGGNFISYKGAKADEEINEAQNAINVLGGAKLIRVEVILPGLEDKRALIFVTKKDHTPEKYPRKAGMPEKKPL